MSLYLCVCVTSCWNEPTVICSHSRTLFVCASHINVHILIWESLLCSECKDASGRDKTVWIHVQGWPEFLWPHVCWKVFIVTRLVLCPGPLYEPWHRKWCLTFTWIVKVQANLCKCPVLPEHFLFAHARYRYIGDLGPVNGWACMHTGVVKIEIYVTHSVGVTGLTPSTVFSLQLQTNGCTAVGRIFLLSCFAIFWNSGSWMSWCSLQNAVIALCKQAKTSNEAF